MKNWLTLLLLLSISSAGVTQESTEKILKKRISRSSYTHYDSEIATPDVKFVPEFKNPHKDEKNNQKAIMKLIKQEFRKRD